MREIGDNSLITTADAVDVITAALDTSTENLHAFRAVSARAAGPVTPACPRVRRARAARPGAALVPGRLP